MPDAASNTTVVFREQVGNTAYFENLSTGPNVVCSEANGFGEAPIETTLEVTCNTDGTADLLVNQVDGGPIPPATFTSRLGAGWARLNSPPPIIGPHTLGGLGGFPTTQAINCTGSAAPITVVLS